jgi:hypothetical protein
MTTIRCERHGQTEIGIISHEGNDFAALGATVHGKEITAYTRNIDNQIVLTTWCGKTMLDCRNEVVRKFWSGSLAIVFRLTHGRFIVGYALDESGMLFRGELLTNVTDEEAKRIALRISDDFAEIDAEDEANFDQDAA